jgi:hypothetical protein
VKSTGENTHMQAVHAAKLNAKGFQKRQGTKKTGETWWK